jgi:hypothetical protein
MSVVTLTVADSRGVLNSNLCLVEDPDVRLNSTARANIAAWLEREAATSYRGPRPEQAAELDQLIEHTRHVLGALRADLLRFNAASVGAGPDPSSAFAQPRSSAGRSASMSAVRVCPSTICPSLRCAAISAR